MNDNLKNKGILIIEDSKDVQDSLKMALEIDGYNVVTANNGKEALDKLKKIPTPCLILLDLMMPIMNGWEFMDIINKDILLSAIPIVIVSAFSNKGDNFKVLEYIQKPIDLNTLLSTVSKHCG